MTSFGYRAQRGQDKRRTRPGHRAHRVDRVEGRGQEEDKAQPQSPATELTEFRGGQEEDKRRTRPSHRAQS